MRPEALYLYLLYLIQLSCFPELLYLDLKRVLFFAFFFSFVKNRREKNSTLITEVKYSHVLQVGERKRGKGRECSSLTPSPAHLPPAITEQTAWAVFLLFLSTSPVLYSSSLEGEGDVHSCAYWKEVRLTEAKMEQKYQLSYR